jgi:two-component system, OmpR family, alkaline phosphatase synthesis response regulator PhoP
MTSKKILIVDDSKNIRKLVSVVLKNEGYEFSEVSNGLDALSRVKLERPDLVILDVVIPGMNGINVCREIKNDPVISSTAVIILTSEATYEAMDAAKDAGADMFMTKPFEPKDLRSAVRGVLDAKVAR